MSGPHSVDVVTIGRANLDLYSQDVGAPFEDTTGFDAMVGGSPTNIAIGAARLGCSSMVLTAVGDDRTGDFVLRYLRDEGVRTDHVQRIPGKLTSLALLGVQPPDHFPLSFYREDPADIYLTSEVVDEVDLSAVRSVEVSGNALARGPCVEAVFRLVSLAAANDITVYLDVDLRPSEWDLPTDYGEAIRGLLPHVDVVIGTEEEFCAALLPNPEAVMHDGLVPADRLDELATAVSAMLDEGPRVIVTKRGPRGVTIESDTGAVDIAGFPVEVVNTVGAGDAFAAGLIRSRLRGLAWTDAARFANACGAIVVTRHGCSAAFPTEDEVMEFLAGRAS